MASSDSAGIQGDDSAINMAARNVTVVAMDEATAASTAASSAIPPPDENVEMGGDGVLDYSSSPTTDEPPATRQRKDGDPGAMTELATLRERPSSVRTDSRPPRRAEATSP